MTDFDKILWGFIFSAIGVAFGWTLNQLGQWLRTRQEDKKGLKVVLFHLLETYFIFVRSDLEKYVEKLTEKVHSKIPEDQHTQELKTTIQKLYSDLFKSYLNPVLSTELEVVQESYQKAIKTLATIDPLTAYYLSGKKNVIETFDAIQVWVEEVKNKFPAEKNEIEQSGEKVLGILKPNILQDTLNELEKEIRGIAWKINPYIWFKSVKAIERLKSNANQRLDREIDKLLEQVDHVFGGQ